MSFKASVGPGPLPDPAEDLYVQGTDGTWSRNGFTPDAPAYVRIYSLNSTDRFGLVDQIEDFPKGIFIYDCLSCEGTPTRLFEHIYDFLNQIVVPQANRDGLTSVLVIVNSGSRKSAWSFPPSVDFKLAKHADGKWWGPIGTPDKFIVAFDKKIAAYRIKGAKLRGETLK